MILYYCPDTMADRYGQRIRAAAIARKAPSQIMVGTRFEGNSLFVPEGVCHVHVNHNLDQLVENYAITHVVIDGASDGLLWRAPTSILPRDAFNPILIRDPAELYRPSGQSGVLLTSTGPTAPHDEARILEAWPRAVVDHHFPLIEVMPRYKVVVAPAGRAIWEARAAGANLVAFARHPEEVTRAEQFDVPLVDLDDTNGLRVAIHKALQAAPPSRQANRAAEVAQMLVGWDS